MKEEYKEDKKMKKQNKKQAKKNAMFRKLRKYVKDKYDKEVTKKEKKLGRELDRKEKKKIIDHIINSVGIQAMASRTAVSVALDGKISTTSPRTRTLFRSKLISLRSYWMAMSSCSSCSLGFSMPFRMETTIERYSSGLPKE